MSRPELKDFDAAEHLTSPERVMFYLAEFRNPNEVGNSKEFLAGVICDAVRALEKITGLKVEGDK